MTILIPVYNDWESVSVLIPQLDQELRATSACVDVLLVDDGSDARQDALDSSKLLSISGIRVLHLRRNLGHQRAIAVGLAWIHEHVLCDAIVVMDADGEDRPSDVPRLLRSFGEAHGTKIIFAERQRRTEGMTFRMFYWLYRAVHFVLTGVRVRVGNFSVISFDHLSTLVSVSDLWNHYAAAVFKSRLRHEGLPLARGVRIAGRSHMNFVSLVTHGLSAISVFGETVGVRLLIGSIVGFVLVMVLLAAAALVQIRMDLPLPAWAPYALGLVVVSSFNFLTVAGMLTFSILASRNNLSFVPIRDYACFVKSVSVLTSARG